MSPVRDGFHALADELETLMGRGVDEPLDDEEFDRLALCAFRVQYEGNELYARFCRRRGRTPAEVRRWWEVPAVPATAFKHLELVVGDPENVERVFRTSGTSRDAAGCGRHLVPRLSLYRASLLPNLEAHLLPDGTGLPLISLVPPPEEAPESSLSTMIGFLARELCGEVHWCLDEEGAPELDAFLAAVEAHAGAERGVAVVGTAFAFVHLLDALEDAGVGTALPARSRIMETGGFKGRSRTVSRVDLYGLFEERLGVPPARVVNEYGMTELLSQLYEPMLREGPDAPRRHVTPPWLRVRALDPVSLAPLPPGDEGLLAFFDLANAGSVSAILTEDVGAVSSDGVRLRGRARGAEPRGCSLALEELLQGRAGDA